MLSILRSGGTKKDAADAISLKYVKELDRFADRHGSFRVAMDHARAEGGRTNIIAEGGETIPAEITDTGARVAPVHMGPPRAHTAEAAEIMDVDLDLVSDIDASLPVTPGLPRMSAMSVLAFQWKTMHDKSQPPLLRKACNDVVTSYVLGPAMAAQQRRNERAQRLELSESTIIDAESVDTGGSGLEIIEAAGTVLEIPANGSEAPGHAPTPRDEAHP